ncbi:MAG: cytochrome c oxidase subunit II [Acidiferrobacteraceae bacterium]
MTLFKRLAAWSVVSAAGFFPVPALARYPWNFPAPVTPIAQETLYVHDIFLAIIVTIFLLVLSVFLYSIFWHRKSRGYPAAKFTKPRTPLQLVLISIPFLVLTFIDYVILGIPAYHAVLALANTHNSRMVVRITGSQWKWQYAYPGLGIKYISRLSTPEDQIDNEDPKNPHFLRQVNHPLVLPVDEKIRLLVTSDDVLHSWWVPAFGIKQTAVPGFLRSTWVNIDKPGIYRGQCASLCGIGHAFMPIVVVAKSQVGFQRWVRKEQAAQAKQVAETSATMTKGALLAHGKKVFQNNCSVCHQATGLGIPGTFPPIAAGHPFQAPPQMTQAIQKRGFYKNGVVVIGPVANHIQIVLHGIPDTPMPAFASQLSDIDIAAVITYERNSFGNHTGDVIQPNEVRNAREEH